MEKKIGEMKVDVEWKDDNDKEWKMKKKTGYILDSEWGIKPRLAGNM